MVSTRSSSRSERREESSSAPSEKEKDPPIQRNRAALDVASSRGLVCAAKRTATVSASPKGKTEVCASRNCSQSEGDAGLSVERIPHSPESALDSIERTPEASVRKSSDGEMKPNRATTVGGSGEVVPCSSAATGVQDSVSFVSADFSIFTEDRTSAFVRRDGGISQLCRGVAFQSYREQSIAEFGPHISNQHFAPQRRGVALPPLGPVLLLDVGTHFDCDQLWEEIELRNKPLLSHVQRRLRNIRLNQIADAERKENDNRPSHHQEGDECGVETCAEKRITPPSSGEIEEKKDTSTQIKSYTTDPDKIILALKRSSAKTDSPPKRKVTFALDSRDPVVGDGVTHKSTASVNSLDDGFFSLKDMELFANEAEQLAIAGKLVESDDEQLGDDPATMQVSTQGLTPNKPGSEHSAHLRYGDFFDPPTGADQAESMEKLTRVSRLLGSAEGNEIAGEESVSTPLTAALIRSRQVIDAIEEQNIKKRPWQLRGEVTGHARPRDSLLNADMDHDSSERPKLLGGIERNEAIEDLIRQRIIDGLFDDVVRCFPENSATHRENRRETLPDISQEEPSEGLGDVYAHDFITEKERARNDQRSRAVEKESEVQTAEQKEVTRLYEKLSSKLDALAGVQFAPSNDATTSEMMVQGKVMALTSEEAIPEGVSDANVLTPRETYSADRRTLVGAREATKIERKATRAKVKRGKAKTIAAKHRAAELMQQTHPQLLEKRRAEEALLRRGKKIRSAAPPTNAIKMPALRFGSGSKNNAQSRRQVNFDKGHSASSLIL